MVGLFVQNRLTIWIYQVIMDTQFGRCLESRCAHFNLKSFVTGLYQKTNELHVFMCILMHLFSVVFVGKNWQLLMDGASVQELNLMTI